MSVVAAASSGSHLSQGWRSLLETGDPSIRGRATRGRTLARGGRLSGLVLSPGLASARVGDANPRLRVEPFTKNQWARLTRLLHSRLDWVADLMDGVLSPGLLEAARSGGCQLMPKFLELDSDCDCGDFSMPCAHVAAVHHVVADVLDGDPFALFTLRGRPPDILLGALRRGWGAQKPADSEASVHEEPHAEGWYGSSVPVVSFSVRSASEPAVRELGPLPGDDDLRRALAPFYEAGSAAAMGMAHADANATTTPTESWVQAAPAFDPQHDEVLMADAQELTERLVNMLAECTDGMKSRALASQLCVDVAEVRDELLELEKLGVVYRTGQTRGTRWWLG